MNPRRRRFRAFTLTELLVVISIIILILSMAVPAFNSLIYSSARSTAQNALQVAITAARDAAIRSESGYDAGAVFTFNPHGRLASITCVKAGVLLDLDPSGNPVQREVFVPAVGAEPVQFPPGWGVSGFAIAPMIDDAQNPNDPSEVKTGWYDSGTYPKVVTDAGNWLFPESGCFGTYQGADVDDGNMGRGRQTFMVRFSGGFGTVELTNDAPVLVVLPSPSLKFRSASPFRDHRLDQASDLRRMVERILADPSLSAADRRRLLGDQSSDTVLVRPVPQVAVYNMRRMAAAAGSAGLSKWSASLYSTDNNGLPRFDPLLFGGAPDAQAIARRLNNWIEGQDDNGTAVESDAIVYSFQRYLGTPQEVLPPEVP